MIDLDSLNTLVAAAKKLDAGFANLPEFTPQTPGAARMTEVLDATATRLQDNYPYFHPLYAGQMLKPPHPVARLELQLAQQDVAVLQSQLDEGKVNLREVERARVTENEKWMAYLDANFQRQQAQLDLLQAAGQLDKVWQ